jgi:hypothetical protein
MIKCQKCNFEILSENEKRTKKFLDEITDPNGTPIILDKKDIEDFNKKLQGEYPPPGVILDNCDCHHRRFK